MGGIDSYDWSVFGGANPVPGDPDAVRAEAGALADTSDDATTHHRTLLAIGSDTAAVWQGRAADAFHPRVTTLAGRLAIMASSYSDASDALAGYWPALAEAQSLALVARARAVAAQAELLSAQSALATATADRSGAASAYDAAATAPPSPAPSGSASPSGSTHPSPAASAAMDHLRSANAAVSGAAAGVASAQSQMDAACALRDQAVRQAHVASTRCATGLRAASAKGIHNPHHSFWSEVAEVATAVVHDVAQPAKLVDEALGDASLVLSVAAFIPVVGEFAEAANEAVIGAKAIDDAVLLAAGDHNAGALLAEDGLLAATGGLGRVFGLAADTTRSVAEVDDASEALAGAMGRATTATARVSDASDALDEATATGDEARAAGDTFRTLDDPTGPPSLFTYGAERADAEAADADADAKSAGVDLDAARSDADDAEARVEDAQGSLAEAVAERDAVGDLTRLDAVVGVKTTTHLVGSVGDDGFAAFVRANAGGSPLNPVVVQAYYARYLAEGGAAAASNLATRGVDLAAEGSSHVYEAVTGHPVGGSGGG